MPNVAPLMAPKIQFFDSNGNPLAGGLIYFYQTGTNVPQDTWTDHTGAVKNTNPVTLDSGGYANIWLGPYTYTVTAHNSSDASVWSVDGVVSLTGDLTVNSITVTNGVTASGDISGLSYNKVVEADTQSGIDAGSKLAAALAKIQSRGGGIVEASGLDGAQTITQDIFSGITVPGVLRLSPAGVYSFTAEQNVPSYWRIDGGVAGFPNSGSQVQAGAILKWTGANSKNVLKVFNAHNVQIHNININGNQTTGSTGILFDGTNNPPGHNCVFENLTIKDCAVGFQWGTSAVNDYQLDTTQIRNVQISGTAPFASTASGIVINSGNAGQASVIENCVFQVINIGIDIQEVGGLFTIDRCVAGSLGGTTPIAIKITSCTDILVKSCQSESGASGKNFISIGGAPSNIGSITLINNRFDEPVTVNRTASITSISNYGTSTGTLTAGSPVVISIRDRFPNTTMAGWDASAAGTVQRLGGGDSGSDLPTIDTLPAHVTTIVGQMKSTTVAKTRVINTFSATPVFDASTGDIQQITITADVTSSTVTNPTDGQILTFIIIEANSGGHAFAWPANFKGATAITTTNGVTNVQSFVYNSTSTTWYQIPSAA